MEKFLFFSLQNASDAQNRKIAYLAKYFIIANETLLPVVELKAESNKNGEKHKSKL